MPSTKPIISTKMKPEQLQAHLGRRSSNAAGTHNDVRTKRNRDRSARNRNAVADQS